MSLSTVRMLHIDTPALPRGAMLVDMIHSAFIAAFRPSPARPLTRAEEAAGARELARKLRNTDPSFAADLLAAAMRHEALDDAGPARH
ncbi:MAG: hypothetical protein RJA10_1339 [Pseudomonadota bacterium]|jgi:hypothetical protein